MARSWVVPAAAVALALAVCFGVQSVLVISEMSTATCATTHVTDNGTSSSDPGPEDGSCQVPREDKCILTAQVPPRGWLGGMSLGRLSSHFFGKLRLRIISALQYIYLHRGLYVAFYRASELLYITEDHSK